MPRKVMAAVLAVGLCLRFGPAEGQRLAVYQSEANFARYRGVYQEPLRTWLQRRGEDIDVIGDEVAADAARLASFPIVLASSAYVVPRTAAQALAAYVRDGGSLIWFDSPAGCRDPDLRGALGLGEGTTYAPLRDCVLRPKGTRHPAALLGGETRLGNLTGNFAIEVVPDATVLYEVEGTAQDGKRATYAAVLTAHHGAGVSLCFNWVVWLNREPEVGQILADGFEWLLARYRLQRQAVVGFGTPVQASVHQPSPLGVTCKLFCRKDLAPEMAHGVVNLRSETSTQVSAPAEATIRWSYDDGSLVAGAERVEVSTAGLPDGNYSVTFRSDAGGGTWEAREVPVMLDGQLRARLRAEGQERRELLEPLLRGTLGDYDAEPRTPDGRVDLPRLEAQIATANMNMYDWLIWHAPTDWEDLHRFLPLARRANLKVWVTLCPPSEQGDPWSWSEPYRLDYLKWAEEIGKLSREYDNLVALVIDDFWSGGNRSLFTPDYVARFVGILREQNPKVAFLPTIYWSTVGDEEWIENYGPLIDGIVFPYAELETGDALNEQLAVCREWLGPEKFLLINVYASGSSGTGEKGPRTADYMRRALTVSREKCDGIRIYCLPKEKLLEDHRYAIAAELYGKWRAEGSAPGPR